MIAARHQSSYNDEIESRQGSKGDPCIPENNLRTKHWTEGLDHSALTCVEITPRPSVNAVVMAYDVPASNLSERMKPQDDDTAPEKTGGSLKELRLPSGWLAFYSCTLLLGCLYLIRLVWTGTTLFPILTALLAATACAAGVLLSLQNRVGLSLYIAIAFGIIVFAAYRFAFGGYTFGRVGMVIGGLLMLAGYSSVAEELPKAGHNNPMDRSGGSAAS